jgi:hypothetical protein
MGYERLHRPEEIEGPRYAHGGDLSDLRPLPDARQVRGSVWWLHRDTIDPSRWTVSHGPTGLSVPYVGDHGAMRALATALAKAAPQWGADLTTVGRPWARDTDARRRLGMPRSIADATITWLARYQVEGTTERVAAELRARLDAEGW